MKRISQQLRKASDRLKRGEACDSCHNNRAVTLHPLMKGKKGTTRLVCMDCFVSYIPRVDLHGRLV